MTVKAILKEKGGDVFTMSPDATLVEVAQELSRRKIGALLIMDGDRLAGILSERDIVRQIARAGAAALSAPASSVMTQTVQTATMDDLIEDVMTRMTNSRFRHMPVVHEGKVAGLISIGDVVKRRIEQAVRERDEIRDYIMST
ncbi:inosine-5-monophosphate dehydrogenase [Acuticoccus sediminis]|uniref:Inosine-5-monophosphate dehydrogenase n=1 Tax=Acuticoccus sediminis TaxID=2184697 RepID=A0A8B2NNR1_9HYPH|nr:CBS domain-containing protein [Acuticoccus sediminis]RAH98719.1 inosine-5-monophosphate dehydrogenase [Acuticoccus sediminis]